MRIGSIAGIEIRLHSTFLIFLFLLLAVSFSYGTESMLYTLLTLTGLFGSVLVHELAHSLVARALGLRVRDIVLLPIGGASEILDIGANATKEFLTALVGPLTSLALGLLLLGSTSALGAVAHPSSAIQLSAGWTTLVAFLKRLGVINMLLAGFNILPIFPLDGGRVLRAALTGVIGKIAATKVVVFLGIAGGILLILDGLLVRGLMTAVIGGFIVFAALAEYRNLGEPASPYVGGPPGHGQAYGPPAWGPPPGWPPGSGSFPALDQYTSLRGHSVAHVMAPDPRVLDARLTVGQVTPWVLAEGRGFPVVASSGYIGMVYPSDLIGADPSLPLGLVADRDVPLLQVHEPLHPDAVSRIAACPRNEIPVASGGVIIGYLRKDVVQRLLAGAPWPR